jgi:hypothetical protein
LPPLVCRDGWIFSNEICKLLICRCFRFHQTRERAF